jgi:uncharacterized protein (DUF885 family)
MMDNVGMTGEEAVAEVERYFVDPGHALAYEVGMLNRARLARTGRHP